MGDAQLGVIDGIIATKPGWIQKKEVVEVTFDPRVIPYVTMLNKAKACQCTAQIFTRTDAQQVLAAKAFGKRAKRTDEAVRIDDDKYYASRTALRALPMTPLQAARINAAVGAKKDFLHLLSPSQRTLLKKIEAHAPKSWPSAIGVAFRKAWTAASAHQTAKSKQ